MCRGSNDPREMRPRFRRGRVEGTMRASCFLCFSILVMSVVVTPSIAAAQAQDSPQALRAEIDQIKKDFEALKQQYGDRLAALEAKLNAIPGGQTATPATPGGAAPAVQVPPGAAGAGGPSGALPVYGSAVAGSKVFNPDIAVIGDFLGAGGPNAVAPGPALALHESEAAFQAVVDPYARADFFVSFGEQGV